MAKENIKINFTDFWGHFDKTNNFFTKWLSHSFHVTLSDNPDFLIYSCYGSDHLKFSCYRIFFNGENMRVNWNACDFAFGFDYLDHERYFRLPNWFLYEDPRALIEPRGLPAIPSPEKRTFCNMVVSNGQSKKRIDFFHLLSSYKKVDSGGRYLNNIGGPVDDKLAFIRKYKFTLAFENSSYPGYTTEKIFEPFLEKSIPIYWGDPLVGNDFNTAAFVNYSDYGSDAAVLKRIIELDQHDDLYLSMLAEPAYKNNMLPVCADEQRIIQHCEKIFSIAGKQPPVAKTARKLVYAAERAFKHMDFFANRFLKHRQHFR